MRWPWRRRIDVPDIAADLRDEFDTHLAMRSEDNRRNGMSEDTARDEAEHRFGPSDRPARHSLRIRAQRLSLRRTLAADLRQAWIAVTRAPVLSIAGLAVTAIGLSTVFGAARIADALLVRAPTGVRDGARLYSMLDSRDGEHRSMMTPGAFQALEIAAADLQPFAWSQRELQVLHPNDSRVVSAELVSGSYFAALRTRVRAGRLLGPADVVENARVAVVSDRLSRRLAASDARVVGNPLTVNGQSFVIVGVAERHFQGVEAASPVDIWLPLSAEPIVATPTVLPDGTIIRGLLNTPGVGFLRAGVRLRPDESPGTASDRLTGLIRAADDGAPPNDRRRVILDARVWASPYPPERLRLETVLRPIVWAAVLTLILTAACLGSLVVGRLTGRQHELSVRLALGAGRGRLQRVALFELGLIVGTGAALGLAGSIGIGLLAADLQLAAGVRVADVSAPIDGRTLAMLPMVVVGLCLMSAAIGRGVIRRLGHRSIVAATRVAGGGSRERRLLMSIQVATGCALLSASALLTFSIDELRSQRLGFDAEAVAFLRLNPTADGLDSTARAVLARRFLELAPTIGAEVALLDLPTYSNRTSLFVFAERSDEERAFPLPTSRVSAGFFRTMGIDIVAGRGFEPGDETRPVAVISQPLADLYWAGQQVVGHYIRIGGPSGERRQIVGVVAGVRDATLRAGLTPRLYLPFDETAEALTLVARPRAGRPAELLPSLVASARQLDARLVPVALGTFHDLAEQTIAQRVLMRTMTGIIGAGSLLLVAAGVWGLAYTSMRRRWREFGIRQALGARRLQVARLALGDAMYVAVVGGLAGALASWQFGLVIESWLFGIEPSNPFVIAGVSSVVILMVFGGAAGPARQASLADPAELLREQ